MAAPTAAVSKSPYDTLTSFQVRRSWYTGVSKRSDVSAKKKAINSLLIFNYNDIFALILQTNSRVDTPDLPPMTATSRVTM